MQSTCLNGAIFKPQVKFSAKDLLYHNCFIAAIFLKGKSRHSSPFFSDYNCLLK
jgi:hypothetical protein